MTTHWARKRETSQTKVREIALELFLSEGFEAITMEHIAQASGVSRRSIYRYFGNKEGIFFSNQRARLERFQTLTAHIPPGDSPYAVVLRAVQLLARDIMVERESVLAQYRLIEESQSLLPLEANLIREWDDAMLQAIDRGPNQGDPMNKMVAGAVMGMVRALLRAWVEGGGQEDLGLMGDRAFEALEKGFNLNSARQSPSTEQS